jgi:seryl-tRNA synthetase
MVELIKRGEISQEATGIYALGPLVTRLIDYFESRFLELAEVFGAQPYRFPTLIPARYLERVNYFRAFPHSLTFVTHLREDLDAIDHFSQHAACDEHGCLTTPMDSFAGIQTLLSPAVCYHLYFALADQPLPEGQVVATAVGNCFRYEAINLARWNAVEFHHARSDLRWLERLCAPQSRSRPPAYADRLRTHRVSLPRRERQRSFLYRRISQAGCFPERLPAQIRNSRRTALQRVTLAVGSYNYHQDFFGRSLNMTLPDGSPAHTGCVAFGLERIAFAFLSQYGLDPAQWPVDVCAWLESH